MRVASIRACPGVGGGLVAATGGVSRARASSACSAARSRRVIARAPPGLSARLLDRRAGERDGLVGPSGADERSASPRARTAGPGDVRRRAVERAPGPRARRAARRPRAAPPPGRSRPPQRGRGAALGQLGGPGEPPTAESGSPASRACAPASRQARASRAATGRCRSGSGRCGSTASSCSTSARTALAAPAAPSRSSSSWAVASWVRHSAMTSASTAAAAASRACRRSTGPAGGGRTGILRRQVNARARIELGEQGPVRRLRRGVPVLPAGQLRLQACGGGDVDAADARPARRAPGRHRSATSPARHARRAGRTVVRGHGPENVGGRPYCQRC